MNAEVSGATSNWLHTGQEVFPAMLDAIDAARVSVSLETYIFSSGTLGESFRDALVRAADRGVCVRVLVDALGSYGLSSSFWDSLRTVGGEVRRFNPLSWDRMGIRDHRKLLVCDEAVAFIGGVNIAPESAGDGVNRGWCDIGLRLEGPLVFSLARAFDEMFERSDFKVRRFVKLCRTKARKVISALRQPGTPVAEPLDDKPLGANKVISSGPDEQLLLSGPGMGRNPLKIALRKDLAGAESVQIMVAYFLPTWRLRRQLIRIARRGGRVQLLLAGRSDVLVSQWAARSLYRRLLKEGVEIYEYQPQVLHAKLLIIDGVVYVGSANLDPRSLNINYELMVRFRNPGMSAYAREFFANNLRYCRRITLEEWRKTRSLWRRLKQRWAYFLLVRVDPYIAERQWQAMPKAVELAQSETRDLGQMQSH